MTMILRLLIWRKGVEESYTNCCSGFRDIIFGKCDVGSFISFVAKDIGEMSE